MRDCPSQKQETHDTRTRKRDMVPDHARRKAHADQVVRKALVVWGNDTSESEEDDENHEDVSMMAIKDDESIFNSIFSLMANSDDEEDSNEVTFLDLKNDLDTLHVNKLRKLAALLIDSVVERTTKNLLLNEKISMHENENSTLIAQVSKMSIRIGILETCVTETSGEPGPSASGKRKLSIFEEELELKLKDSESKLTESLEINSQLRKDLSRIKEKLSQSLKWVDSSRMLSNLANQGFNGKKGLGCRPIDPPFQSP